MAGVRGKAHLAGNGRVPGKKRNAAQGRWTRNNYLARNHYLEGTLVTPP